MNNLEDIYYNSLKKPEKILSYDKKILFKILEKSLKLLEKTPQLIRLHGDILIVGDTHGDVHTSIYALKNKIDQIIFLGDYVDRGPFQFENLIMNNVRPICELLDINLSSIKTAGYYYPAV